MRHSKTKNDSFVHHKSSREGSHPTSPETLDHLESKTSMLRWILDNYSEHIEDHDLDTRNIAYPEKEDSRQLRPDCWIKLTNGIQISIEYQHSAGNYRRIEEKNRIYRDKKIEPWWIFSTETKETFQVRKRNLYRSRYGFSTIDLSTTQKFLARKGIRFYWFDRSSRRIGVPVIYRKVPVTPKNDEHWEAGKPVTEKMYGGHPDKSFYDFAFASGHPLGECWIDLESGKLLTPTHDRIATDREKLLIEMEQQRSLARANQWKIIEEQKNEQLSADKERKEKRPTTWPKSSAPPTPSSQFTDPPSLKKSTQETTYPSLQKADSPEHSIEQKEHPGETRPAKRKGKMSKLFERLRRFWN